MYTLYFRPCDVWQFRQLSIELRRTGLRDATNDVRVFFLPDQCPRQHKLLAKNGISDQTDGIYTLFQTKMAKSVPYFRLEMLENDTLWGGTYLYGLYMGVPPLPPPPGNNLPTAKRKLEKIVVLGFAASKVVRLTLKSRSGIPH